jgi:2-oxoglutarate dehydrogenase E1 component
LREEQDGLANIAFVRLEQLAPFPAQLLDSIMRDYPNLQGVAWAQEEPAKNGAASFIRDELVYKQTVPTLHDMPNKIKFISRPESATPADGHPMKHGQSQQRLYKDILEWYQTIE